MRETFFRILNYIKNHKCNTAVIATIITIFLVIIYEMRSNIKEILSIILDYAFNNIAIAILFIACAIIVICYEICDNCNDTINAIVKFIWNAISKFIYFIVSFIVVSAILIIPYFMRDDWKNIDNRHKNDKANCYTCNNTKPKSNKIKQHHDKTTNAKTQVNVTVTVNQR